MEEREHQIDNLNNYPASLASSFSSRAASNKPSVEEPSAIKFSLDRILVFVSSFAFGRTHIDNLIITLDHNRLVPPITESPFHLLRRRKWV